MPTPKTTARKSKTVREGVAAKLSHIERALADIRQMVDMNCGEAVLRTARAAGAAAAEEVLTTLAPTLTMAAPAAAQLFNTPPAPFEALPTLAVPPPKSSRRTKKESEIQSQEENTVSPLTQAIIDQDKIFEAEDAAARNALAPPKSSRRTKKASKIQPQEENTVSPLTQAIIDQDKIFAAEDAAAKKPGPKLWNEFLRNYMSRQEASGRKITRLQAMAEAGPNYRTKYGISEKKNRITAKVAKTMGAVQVAPVERPANVNGYSLINRGAVPVVPTTPGRQSPPIPLNVPTTSPGILNTLRAALTTGKLTPSNNSLKTSTSFSGSSVTSPQANAPQANAPMSANAPQANRPNTNYYDYENMGMEENGTRKVRIGGEDYLMTNQNRGIFRPVNGSLEWVGYLEPGGQIRATNSPE
jgi:hypothetical protein